LFKGSNSWLFSLFQILAIHKHIPSIFFAGKPVTPSSTRDHLLIQTIEEGGTTAFFFDENIFYLLIHFPYFALLTMVGVRRGDGIS
jgi:hypothetical protein